MEREEALAAAVTAIVQPLTTPSPVAADERYLDLRQEVGKLSALAGEAVDWRRVVHLGTTLLSEVGKDLLVASYTALALHELHGVGGLASGLGAITQLLRGQAASMSPTRSNARASALEWLLDRLKATLGGPTPAPADAAPLQAVERELLDLQSACRELLGERSPGFRGLLDVVHSLLLTLPGADADPPAVERSLARADPIEAAEPSTPDAGASSPTQSLAERSARWLAPIDAEGPCGADPRGLPRFGELREEIAKASALAADVSVDWSKAWRLADDLLRDHAKDMQVAAWLAIAGSRRDGVPGLVVGLAAFAELVDAFWPDIHPRRPKPRKDTAAWLVAQAQATLVNAAIELLRPPLLAELEVVCERLGAVLHERLVDDAPGLRPLRECITQLRADLEARTAAAAQETAATMITPPPDTTDPGREPPRPPPIVTTVAVADAIAAPADLAGVDAFLTSTGQALASTARAIREAQAADPRAYRLLRAGLWLHLRSAPTPRADGTTGVSGLSERDREQLAALHDGGKWLGLLTRSENLLVNHRLALDLHRLSAAALTGLGPEYAAARLGLQAELRALLTRLPTLSELKSSDGLPLADPLTQRWIAAEILPRGGAHASSEAKEDDAGFWSELRERLRQEDRESTLAEAQTRVDAAPSERLRFLGQLQLAEACDDAGDARLAAALFAALAEAAQERGLDRWDPGLALRYLGGLARACHRSGDPTGARAAIGRLGRVHAPSAVDLLRELV